MPLPVPPSIGISDIWNNMVNFIHYFGYKEFGYMEFPLIWDILARTNAFLVSGIVCSCSDCFISVSW